MKIKERYDDVLNLKETAAAELISAFTVCDESKVKGFLYAPKVLERRNMPETNMKRYFDTRFLLPMSIIPERFFFIDGYTIDECSKRVLPSHPKKQLFLSANLTLWQLVDIQHIAPRMQGLTAHDVIRTSKKSLLYYFICSSGHLARPVPDTGVEHLYICTS